MVCPHEYHYSVPKRQMPFYKRESLASKLGQLSLAITDLTIGPKALRVPGP